MYFGVRQRRVKKRGRRWSASGRGLEPFIIDDPTCLRGRQVANGFVSFLFSLGVLERPLVSLWSPCGLLCGLLVVSLCFFGLPLVPFGHCHISSSHRLARWRDGLQEKGGRRFVRGIPQGSRFAPFLCAMHMSRGDRHLPAEARESLTDLWDFVFPTKEAYIAGNKQGTEQTEAFGFLLSRGSFAGYWLEASVFAPVAPRMGCKKDQDDRNT